MGASLRSHLSLALRKNAHAVYSVFIAVKTETFLQKIFDSFALKFRCFLFCIIFPILAQNIDCGYMFEPPRRGGFNEYPQSTIWSKRKKNRHTPAKPSFFYIEVGFKGVCTSRTCFSDGFGAWIGIIGRAACISWRLYY